MKTFPKMMQPSKHEFTPWTTPKRRYKIGCCDCGLVHDMEFRIILSKKLVLDGRKTQIQFRLRRNIKSTAALRAADTRKSNEIPNQRT